mmetsp:Transcript_25422/g.40641  ORF Transcript_25422/g.40641 Transcript_25422/m.40641 type:complete len:200 (+) Transcript_25422:210-809(+)
MEEVWLGCTYASGKIHQVHRRHCSVISVHPPSMSTCPAALSLSSTTPTAASMMPPHDKGGEATNAPCPFERISTLDVISGPEVEVSPPSTTKAPSTAQHTWPKRAVISAGIVFHRIVAGSSRHTSLTTSSSSVSPPHTTRPGSVLRNSFAPAHAALHTSISRHAPTSPRCPATMAHISEREVARYTAQLVCARVVGPAM